MSVCGHNPYCPGHGPEHDEATRPRGAFEPVYVHPPVLNPGKDRSLPGKRRRKARQGRH